MSEERAMLVKEWAAKNNTPVQELCPEFNQYMKMSNGYEMWNSRTLIREKVDFDPTRWNATTTYGLVNRVSARSSYEGLYVRYIDELDAMEISFVECEGGRGQNGVAKKWKYGTGAQYFVGYYRDEERYFFFKGDAHVYTGKGIICNPNVGGRYNKDVYDNIRCWRAFTDRTNVREFEKFAKGVNIMSYCRWNAADNLYWSPDPSYYALWYKKDFIPKKQSSNAAKLDSYELDDVEFEMNTNAVSALYYQELDSEMAVLRFFCYPYQWVGRGDYEADDDGYTRKSNVKTEKARLFISAKGKPTLMIYEAGQWNIKATIPWDCSKNPEVINKEEMETWKPLKYILPCIPNFRLQSIVNYLRHPIVEKLYKSGYQKLAKKVQEGDQIVQNLKVFFLVKSETKQPLFKMLGVNKFVLAAAEQYGSLNVIRELKYFFGNEFEISNCPKEIADAVASYVGSDHYHSLVSLIPGANYRGWYRRGESKYDMLLSDEDRKWISKLIKMENKNRGCIVAYSDVISTYNRLNNKPDIDLYNVNNYNDIVRLHDALVALQVREERERQARYDARRKAEFEATQKSFEKLQKDRVAKYEYEGDDFCVRTPHDLNEITREGAMLHHCVGGYVDRHAKGETNILFLRKKGMENIPFFTVEIRGDKVIQIHGSHNRWLGNEPEAVPFMYEYLTQLGVQFDKSLLLNKGAGYSPGSESLDESYLTMTKAA